MERLIDGERRLRREYSTAFKASVLAQTHEPGASVVENFKPITESPPNESPRGDSHSLMAVWSCY